MVAGGKVFVGTNNCGRLAEALPGQGRSWGAVGVRREGRQIPLAALEREAADWPRPRLACRGICVTARGRRPAVVRHQPRRSALPRYRGFHDDENDGPFKDEANENKDEADVVWVFDMMEELGVSQHNMAAAR